MNTSPHLKLGKKGEQLAIDYLTQKGYTILASRWKYKHKEIDIIATHNDTLVIIEVKTRKTASFGTPLEAVNTKKQQFLAEAAEAFIENYRNFSEIRFDIIAIVFDKQKETIEHIENAFIPGL